MDYTDTILDILHIFLASEQQSKEKTAPFKVIAYQKAIKAIKEYGKEIKTKENVDEIEGIGKKIRAKLYEIVETGTVKEIEEKGLKQVSKIREQLMLIHGIGPYKADQLIDEFGITTIEELIDLAIKSPYILTEAQKIGLQYYYDLQNRIPREEMFEHERFLREFFLHLVPEFQMTVVGSYRRGLESSGDIDILLTYRGITHQEAVTYFRHSIDELVNSNYIIASLGVGKLKYMGVCQLGKENLARRLDILLTKPEEMPCALLYFTGSQKFNVEFRRVANARGYTLNEHALTKISPEYAIPEPPPFRTEKDVFDFLGIEYQYPYERVGPVKLF